MIALFWLSECGVKCVMCWQEIRARRCVDNATDLRGMLLQVAAADVVVMSVISNNANKTAVLLPRRCGAPLIIMGYDSSVELFTSDVVVCVISDNANNIT